MAQISSASVPVSIPREQILAVIYGQAVGDAIGLLTEFLSKEEAQEEYAEVKKSLELEHKGMWPDAHRTRWKEGDWTDDTDQMILIMQSLVNCDGLVKPTDFAEKIKFWRHNGFPDLGDTVGMGVGKTTSMVIANPTYTTQPHQAAMDVYKRKENVASNGAVMRTSMLGVHQFWDSETVAQQAVDICKTTHYDPRCQASTVAVSVAISLMLKKDKRHMKRKNKYRIRRIIHDSYLAASKCLETPEEKKELKRFMEVKKIKKLKLDEKGAIGYTYKCMGTGFWALKQKNFRKAIQKITLEGGDADTNAAVAGALLGCKLGLSALPVSWTSKLVHKEWLDKIIEKYFDILGKMLTDAQSMQ